MRILIADDHTLFRDGLQSMLSEQPGVTIVGTCEDGPAAVRLTKELRPDVVLMDITMPGLNGIEATRQIVREGSGALVVILSMHSDRRYVLEALRSGAKGYFLKNSSAGDLLDGIRGVLAGEYRLSPRIGSSVVQDYLQISGGEQPTAYTVLSDREREILQHLAEGRTTKEISALLHRSVKTIETHRGRIMEKLGLRTVADLTKYAIREGLTSLE